MAAQPAARGGISISLTADLRGGLDEIKRRYGIGPVDYIRGAIVRALVADLGHDWRPAPTCPASKTIEEK